MILKKISLIKYSIPVGVSIMSHELLLGAASFAKVRSIGALELIVLGASFLTCIIFMEKFKKALKRDKQKQQCLPPPNYDEQYSNLNNQQQPNYNEQSGWDCDKEFFTHECGVKYESFKNGVKCTEYEFRRRSSTW